MYRVLDLPPSMRPLVYDYGQLTERAETEYILQIVKHHVSAFLHSSTKFYWALLMLNSDGCICHTIL